MVCDGKGSRAVPSEAYNDFCPIVVQAERFDKSFTIVIPYETGLRNEACKESGRTAGAVRAVRFSPRIFVSVRTLFCLVRYGLP